MFFQHRLLPIEVEAGRAWENKDGRERVESRNTGEENDKKITRRRVTGRREVAGRPLRAAENEAEEIKQAK